MAGDHLFHRRHLRSRRGAVDQRRHRGRHPRPRPARRAAGLAARARCWPWAGGLFFGADRGDPSATSSTQADGTLEGTVLLADIAPGAAPSSPRLPRSPSASGSSSPPTTVSADAGLWAFDLPARVASVLPGRPALPAGRPLRGHGRRPRAPAWCRPAGAGVGRIRRLLVLHPEQLGAAGQGARRLRPQPAVLGLFGGRHRRALTPWPCSTAPPASARTYQPCRRPPGRARPRSRRPSPPARPRRRRPPTRPRSRPLRARAALRRRRRRLSASVPAAGSASELEWQTAESSAAARPDPYGSARFRPLHLLQPVELGADGQGARRLRR